MQKNVSGLRKLSTQQMKGVKGGLGDFCIVGACSFYQAGVGTVTGHCEGNSGGSCVCHASGASVVWGNCKAFDGLPPIVVEIRA